MELHRLIKLLPVFLLYFASPVQSFADGGIIAYYKVAVLKGTVEEISTKVKTVLEASVNSEGQTQHPFKVVGEYSPAKNPGLRVVAFTRDDLISLTAGMPTIEVMAGVMKIGLRDMTDKKGYVEVTLLNPDFVFYAYLRKNINSENESTLIGISEDIKLALLDLGEVIFMPVGETSLDEEQLKEFRYMVKMPGFEESVELASFNTFEEAVAMINSNLHARKNGAYRVYALVPSDFQTLPNERPDDFRRVLPAGSNTAIFGVGLLDQRTGEPVFLTELGDQNIAAMPYELVVESNKVLILNGRFRFPLFWPDLTMAQYRKINKTPRDVEELMRGLTAN